MEINDADRRRVAKRMREIMEKTPTSTSTACASTRSETRLTRAGLLGRRLRNSWTDRRARSCEASGASRQAV